MSFGGAITILCLAIAVWYVPRYLVRVYAPGFGAAFRRWWQAGIDAQRDRYEERAPLYGLRDVKSYVTDGINNMSSDAVDALPSSPSSLQTDAVQTPDQTEDTAARRKKLLDTYKPLRKLGMSRDDARVFLHSLGLPLDNNLWADAAPADEQPAAHVTPIVGRATNARFETDPEFPYQAPAH